MFPRRRPLPTLRRFCRCGPSGPRIPLVPAPLPAQISTILRRERLPLPLVTSHQSQITKSFRIRTYEKSTRNPFRIRTSKTQDLKPFRMNTSKKTPGGRAHLSRQTPSNSRCYLTALAHGLRNTEDESRLTRHLAFSVQCALLLGTPCD